MRLLSLAVLLSISSAATAQNAYLTNGFVPRYWKASTDYVITVRVRNSNSTPLITFRVDWRYNNGAVQQGNWQSTTGITGNQYWPYVHQIAFNQPESAGTLKVWVVGNGDTDASNDTLTFPVNVLGNWATKTVLMEQYTGTWCQFCPNPNATTNTLDMDPLVVVAKHHNGDVFTSASSTAYWSQFNAEYSPAGVMEQGELGTYLDNAAYDQWTAQIEQRKIGVSPVSIGIQAGFNTWTRLLTVDVDANFTAAQSGTFTLNAYLMEDGVPGPQSNAPAGYIHDQVVREVLGGGSGTTGVIPATTTAGSTYSHQYTYTVPQEWDHNNMRLVAMVTEHRNGKIAAVNTADGDLLVVGVNEIAAGPSFSVFPNPATDALWVKIDDQNSPLRLTLLAADGRVLIDTRSVFTGGIMSVPGFEALAAGIYVVRVEQNGVAGERRVVRTARSEGH